MSKYISQVTNEEIENFLIKNSYILCHDIKSDDGQPLPAIERGDEDVFVRCRRIKEETSQELENLILDSLSSTHKLLYSMLMASSLNYSSDIDVMLFHDYGLNRISVDINSSDESNRLLVAFFDFMLDKFKDTNYEKDIQDYYKDSTPTQI